MVESFSSARFSGSPHRAGHGPVEPAALPDAPARNDGALLAVLRRDLGETVFRDVLAALDEEMERRLRSVQQEPLGWPNIRNDTQAMLSLAAGFGFSTLATLSRAVLSACERPPCRFADVLPPYRTEVHRLRSTITALCRTVGVEGDSAVTADARPARDTIS